MTFGQLVIGPPGSGKSTYCNGMQQYLTAAGRKVKVVNLDPANDSLPYDCAVDVMDLVSLEEVMKDTKLGPNGGLIYCMDYLQHNLDWLKEKLEPLQNEDSYFIFDCPGQVELLTLHSCFQDIVHVITGKWNYRLAAVHLVDSYLCSNPAQYMSALLLSLNVMMSLELPHINVLSKIDLIESQGDLDFNLEFYSEVHELKFLVDAMEGYLFSPRFQKLSIAICEVVEDFSMVKFVPLAIEDKDSVQRIVAHVDKATGYVFTGLAGGAYPPEFLYGAGVTDESTTNALMSYEEKFMKQTDSQKE